MDRFPDGVHVWLRSAVRGDYLFAADDGSGVSQSRIRSMVNAAWRVQRVVLRDGTPGLLLQNAAYGRYLALSPRLAPHGHRGRPAQMCDFDKPRQRNIRWRATAAGDGSDDILLCTLEDQERYLRAHANCSCLTIDSRRSMMSEWTVVEIPPRPAPPALPASVDNEGDWDRKIRCTLANDEGDFIGEDTFQLNISRRSVFNLRSLVAKKVDEEDEFGITLCVQAGSHGRLTPLVVDLPRSQESLDLVVLPTSSEVAQAMVHPNIGGVELLTDGAFVHLTCWVHGKCCYLHAQGDGVGINLSPGPSSLQDVWVVHKVPVDSEEVLLFRSAAYGRYFALETKGEKPGTHSAQVNYEEPEQSNLLWVATALKGTNEVNLSSWNGNKGIDLSWTVEVVPMGTTPPMLPAPVEEKEPKKGTKRLIWHRPGDGMKVTTLVFRGKSLSALRSKVSNDSSVILCVRAGHCGQLTPLVTDLPDNKDTMEIVTLTSGSPAARELRYPMVNPRGV